MWILKGDLWLPSDNVDGICVTTNRILKRNGELVMGAGIDKDAATRFPEIPRIWGAAVKEGEWVVASPVILGGKPRKLIMLPTKDHWKNPSTLKLIHTSILSLKTLVNNLSLKNVWLPPPGCGLGGLNWKDVYEKINPLLDYRFTVVLGKDRGVHEERSDVGKSDVPF